MTPTSIANLSRGLRLFDFRKALEASPLADQQAVLRVLKRAIKINEQNNISNLRR